MTTKKAARKARPSAEPYGQARSATRPALHAAAKKRRRRPTVAEAPEYAVPVPIRAGTSGSAICIDFEVAGEASAGDTPDFDEAALRGLATIQARSQTRLDISLWTREEAGFGPLTNRPTLLFYVFVAGKGGSSIATAMAAALTEDFGRRAVTIEHGATNGMEVPRAGLRGGEVVTHRTS